MNELEQVKIVSNAVYKSILVVCGCILFGITLETCKVDTEKIEVCNEACHNSAGHMKSVTAYECECTSNKANENPWVLN